jgi:hypothetical protein
MGPEDREAHVASVAHRRVDDAVQAADPRRVRDRVSRRVADTWIGVVAGMLAGKSAKIDIYSPARLAKSWA